MTSATTQPTQGSDTPALAINHLAVVVTDIDAALGFWRDALGLPVFKTETNTAEEVQIAFLPIGGGEIELLAPTTETSGVAKYLAKRGAGMHHLCLEVPALDPMVARLLAHGVELINEVPRVNSEGRRYIFIHPRSASGVLVELYERLPEPR
jgi:methylmalonyl-CoA/ethylmalonyl-CoA epimerase